jgi:PST family polysaccharide transporter/lipopolysaccharide exporter
MGYAKQAIVGFGWNSFLKIAVSGLAIIKIAVLARLLSPDDFGLFSLVMIALGITESTTQTGVNVTIIQSKQSVKYFLNTAWVIAIIRGMIIGSLMVMLGILLQNYYDQPELMVLISLTALVPIIKGFINPTIVSMHKELRFFRNSIYHLSLAVVEALAAIIFGLLLHSVWALVFALLAAAIFEVIISFVFFKQRPRFEYRPSPGKEILHNTKGLSLSAALSYVYENVDDLILGKVLGTHNLGLYHNGYALAHKVNYEPAKSVVHSSFPVYTKIAGDAQRLKRGFLKSLIVTIGLVVLASMPILIAPGFFVNLILGNQWVEVVPIVPWLIVAGIIQSMSALIYNLFITKKEYHLINLHLFSSIVLLIGLLVVLPAQYGILGGAMAVLISRVTTLPILILGTVKVLKS